MDFLRSKNREVQARVNARSDINLPGELVPPDPVETVGAGSEIVPATAGDYFVLRVRPDAVRPILLTGYMDTVYGVDDPFKATTWLDDPPRLRRLVIDVDATFEQKIFDLAQ